LPIDRKAAGVLTQVQRATIERSKGEWNEHVEAKLKKQYLDKYEKESSTYYTTSRLWDDGIIHPLQTRGTLGLALLISVANQTR
jgi:3-methylcrotonyl-CoA carboxylase beta subunit